MQRGPDFVPYLSLLKLREKGLAGCGAHSFSLGTGRSLSSRTACLVNRVGPRSSRAMQRNRLGKGWWTSSAQASDSSGQLLYKKSDLHLYRKVKALVYSLALAPNSRKLLVFTATDQ